MTHEITTIDDKIIVIRGQRVMLDLALAFVYGTSTKRLNEQVYRNRVRFPEAFMFQLTYEEFIELKKLNPDAKWYNRRSLPYAFTEYGVLMAANVLKSEIAIHMSIQIINAFVRLREMVVESKELSRRLRKLENKVGVHDNEIKIAFEAIRELMKPPPAIKKNQIGFR